MIYNLIRYGVKDAGIAENRALVTKVFEALDETQPQSVRYLVLELENGEFVHLVGYDKDSSALTELDAFKAFGAGHAEKAQIRMMVGVLLPKADFDSDDAADALAVAICHAHHRVSLARMKALAG